MNLKKLWPTAILALLFSQDALAAVIDSRTWSVNGHLYYLLTPASYVEAETQAVALGGHLATINDQSEHDWVWSTFRAFIPNGVDGAGLWIGYTDSELFGASEGDWAWVSGESPSYTNWYPGEPNDDVVTHAEDFAFVWAVHNGQWLDADITGSGNTVYGVAEVDDRHLVPLPAPLWLLGAGFLSYLGLGIGGKKPT